MKHRIQSIENNAYNIRIARLRLAAIALSSLLYALCSMYCITWIMFYALYYMPCIFCIVFYELHSEHCILLIVFYGLCSMHCVVCLVSYVLYSMHTLLNFKTRRSRTDRPCIELLKQLGPAFAIVSKVSRRFVGKTFVCLYLPTQWHSIRPFLSAEWSGYNDERDRLPKPLEREMEGSVRSFSIVAPSPEADRG